MLEGIKIKVLKRRPDERGSFTELIRKDWKEILEEDKIVQANLLITHARVPCVIGKDTLIVKSYIGPYTSVGDKAQVIDSVDKEQDKLPMKIVAYYYYLLTISKFYKIIPLFSFFGNLIALRAVDKSNRYKKILKMITAGTVLEIGAGSFSPLVQIGLSDVTTLDIKHTLGIDVVGSSSNLPFRDSSFDLVVAIDTIEHLPRPIRDIAIKEMIRVARERVIIHTPLEDGKKFVGRQFDLLFNEWHFKVHGRNEPSTSEHLLYWEPSPDELSSYGFRITGSHNARLWFTYMQLQYLRRSSYMRPVSLFMAHLYYMLNDQKDNLPPFWGGVCVLNKKDLIKIKCSTQRSRKIRR